MKKEELKVPCEREKNSAASVKYYPENRTVFINPARKSVFMELPPGRWKLFGTCHVCIRTRLCVH